MVLLSNSLSGLGNMLVAFEEIAHTSGIYVVHVGLPAQLHMHTTAHAHREIRACQETMCTQLYLSARKLLGDTQSHRGMHKPKSAIRSCMQLVVVNVLCVVCA